MPGLEPLKIPDTPSVSLSSFPSGGSACSTPGSEGVTPQRLFERACGRGDVAEAEELLSNYGHAINPAANNHDAFCRAVDYVCALQTPPTDLDLNILRFLLRDGRVDPGCRGSYAVLMASIYGKDALLLALLATGRVDPTTRHNEPLIRACKKGLLTTVSMLLAVPSVVECERRKGPGHRQLMQEERLAASPAKSSKPLPISDVHALHALLEVPDTPTSRAIITQLLPAVVAAAPAAARIPCDAGGLPLHHAARRVMNTDGGAAALAALTRAYPEAVAFQAAGYLRTPLHSIAARGLATNSSLLLSMIHASREPDWRAALRMRDADGRLPLGVAAATRGSEALLYQLLKLDPGAAADVTPKPDDHDGTGGSTGSGASYRRTPLHDAVAARRGAKAEKVIVALLRACPAAAFAIDSHGQLPAHCTHADLSEFVCKGFLHADVQPVGLQSLLTSTGSRTAAVLLPAFDFESERDAITASAVDAAKRYGAGSAEDTRAIPWFNMLCEINEPQTDAIACAVLAAIDKVSHVRELAEQLDKSGRRAMNVAGGEVRKQLEQRLLLFSRFAIDTYGGADKLHESKTCVVWRAVDHQSSESPDAVAAGSESPDAVAAGSSRSRRRGARGAPLQVVVLKFMRDRDLFEKEIGVRTQLQRAFARALSQREAPSQPAGAAAAGAHHDHRAAAVAIGLALSAAAEVEEPAATLGASQAAAGAGAASCDADAAADAGAAGGVDVDADAEAPADAKASVSAAMAIAASVAAGGEASSAAPPPSLFDFILPVIAAFDLEADASLAANAAEHAFPADLRYVIALPAASRTLADAQLHEALASQPKEDLVKLALKQLCLGAAHMHAAGFVHGDVKPLNIVRVDDGSWRLIDLDASAAIGSEPSSKSSTGYLAPELLAHRLANSDAAPVARAPSAFETNAAASTPASPAAVGYCTVPEAASPSPAAAVGGTAALPAAAAGCDVASSPLAATPLRLTAAAAAARFGAAPTAHPSQDAWSLGVTAFQLCTGQSPWVIGDGGSASEAAVQEILDWTEKTCAEKLARVRSPLARNLISRLLHPDAALRPTLANAARHPFITGASSFERLPGQEPIHDVFISYRWNSHVRLTPLLHAALTARGLRVWWDQRRLADGKDLVDGFCAGMVGSRLALLLTSPSSVAKTQTLTAGSDRDNVYVEHRLALELHGPGCGLLEAVLPVMMPDLSSAADTAGAGAGAGAAGSEPGPDAEAAALVMKGKWWLNPDTFPDIKGGVKTVEDEVAAQMQRLGLGVPLGYGMSPHVAMQKFSRDKAILIAQPEGGEPVTLAQAVATIVARVMGALEALDAEKTAKQAAALAAEARLVTPAVAGDVAVAAAARPADAASAATSSVAVGGAGAGAHAAAARGGSPPRGAAAAVGAEAGFDIGGLTSVRRKLEAVLNFNDE